MSSWHDSPLNSTLNSQCIPTVHLSISSSPPLTKTYAQLRSIRLGCEKSYANPYHKVTRSVELTHCPLWARTRPSVYLFIHFLLFWKVVITVVVFVAVGRWWPVQLKAINFNNTTKEPWAKIQTTNALRTSSWHNHLCGKQHVAPPIALAALTELLICNNSSNQQVDAGRLASSQVEGDFPNGINADVALQLRRRYFYFRFVRNGTYEYWLSSCSRKSYSGNGLTRSTAFKKIQPARQKNFAKEKIWKFCIASKN